MDRLSSELILLSAPPACLSVTEQRRALRLARGLGRALAERDDVERVRVADYRSVGVVPASETGLLTEAGEAYWRVAADVDARVIAFMASFALARAGV